MNTATRSTLMAAAALSVLLLALTALAAGDGDARPGYAPGAGYHALSPEQQKAWLDIRQKHEKVLFDLSQKLSQKRAELNAVLAADQPDEKRVRSLSADIGKLLGDLYAERAALSLELRKAGLPDFGYGRGWHARHGYGMMGGGGYGMGPGMMGPGMMGGYGMGPGMMGGYGPGYGMGPGMMGPGMMGPGMMGPGWGGYGYGMGPGMMDGPDQDEN